MRLINPSVELIQQTSGIEGVYKQIERIGRTCYKSEDKITEDSAKPFVDRMINSKHYAMLEHGTIYLSLLGSKDAWHSEDTKNFHNDIINNYIYNPYSKVIIEHFIGGDFCAHITTNLRVIVENHWEEDLQYICEPTEHHVKRISLKFNTNIGVSREGNRHRVFSIAEQSTRYCNYTKDKFGSEITCIKPCWFNDENNKYFRKNTTLPICLPDSDGGQCLPEFYFKPGTSDVMKNMEDWTPEDYLIFSLLTAEWSYTHLIEEGWKPQQAREVLPLATATEVVYTGFEDDWKHFFDLRYRGTTGAPHPNMLQIATMAHNVIQKELELDL